MNIDITDKTKFNNSGLARNFTVKMSKWLRGEGSNASRLFREEDSKMCCLGFCALASGYKEKDICNFSTLEDVGAVNFDGATLCDLMIANDNPKTTDSQKQKTLTRLFKKIGISVKFVKRYILCVIA